MWQTCDSIACAVTALSLYSDCDSVPSSFAAIDKEDHLMDEWFDLIRQRDELNTKEEEFVYM